jgi:simple sugar transport system substrate-binding protein
VLDGTWQSQDVWWGLKEGMVRMAPYGEAVTAAAAAAGDAVRDGIIAGTLDPFEGPIRNQAGEVVVAAGERLPDEALLTMDWFVEGVQA